MKRLRQLHFPAWLASSLGAMLMLAACATGPRLEPATPQTPLAATEAGVRLIVEVNTWRGYPGSLPSHYTPIALRVENGRQEEILVRYADFVAVDDAGNQYRAVAPVEVAQALFGDIPSRGPAPSALAEARLYAGSWPWGRWGPYRGYGYWPYSPYYDPYFPGLHPWWDYPYTQTRPTPYDVLSLGLREGPVLPGASVEGFLYLQLATQRASGLTLSWTPALRDARPLAPIRMPFRIVR